MFDISTFTQQKLILDFNIYYNMSYYKFSTVAHNFNKTRKIVIYL